MSNEIEDEGESLLVDKTTQIGWQSSIVVAEMLS